MLLDRFEEIELKDDNIIDIFNNILDGNKCNVCEETIVNFLCKTLEIDVSKVNVSDIYYKCSILDVTDNIKGLYNVDKNYKEGFVLKSLMYYNYDDSNIPLVLFDMTKEEYDYKCFDNGMNMVISNARINKLLIYDSDMCYSFMNFKKDVNLESIKNKVLKIDIYSYIRPENVYMKKINNTCNVSYYGLGDNDIKTDNSNIIVLMLLTYKDISYIMLDDYMYYKMDGNLLTEYVYGMIYKGDLIDVRYKSSSNYVLMYDKKYREKLMNEGNQLNKLIMESDKKLIEGIKYMNEYYIRRVNYRSRDNKIFYNLLRFYQRYEYENYLCDKVCNWIIKETELIVKKSGGWLKERHELYTTTDINISNVENVNNYLNMFIKEDIIGKINKLYGLEGKEDIFELIFDDIFIVKYDVSKDGQVFLEKHRDSNIISWQIVLNDDYEGGGTYFDDGILVKVKKGGLLIHPGFVEHMGMSITKGVRYLMVGFMKLKNI